jgi:putative GTP pyrophosphokinase
MDLPIYYNEEDEWQKVMLMYDSALKQVNTKIEILNNEFKLAHQYNPIEHITSRIKTPQSIAKKMRHNGRELTVENIVKYINDVAGIRIICSFTSDIYRIADLITKQSDVQVLKVKDYIMGPKSNGYTSYHMIVSVPIYLSETMVNTKVEIQIRTIAMDFWASLEHKIYYKFEGNAPERIRKELKECADIVSFLDQKMLSLNEEIRIYNPDDAIGQYKDVLSDKFQNMIKESYGTVIDEEFEQTIIQTSIQRTTEIEIEEASEQAAAGTENMVKEEKFKEEKIKEEIVKEEKAREEIVKEEKVKEDKVKEEKVKEEQEDQKKELQEARMKKGQQQNGKDTDKKTEGRFMRLFGLR